MKSNFFSKSFPKRIYTNEQTNKTLILIACLTVVIKQQLQLQTKIIKKRSFKKIENIKYTLYKQTL